MQLEGFVVVEHDVSIQVVCMAMINATIDTKQDNSQALEYIFEEAVKEARELLKECIHGD